MSIQLNKEQEKAVTYDNKKPLLIEAGPGSGKTRVLIERVKFLINTKQVPPESLLIITFTKKAAEELKERLARDIDSKIINKMQISTIHSFCQKLLEDNEKQYQLLDDDNYEKRTMFLSQNLKELGFVKEKTLPKHELIEVCKKYDEYTTFKVDTDKLAEYIERTREISPEYIEFVEKKMVGSKFPKKEVVEAGFKKDYYNAKYLQIAKSYPQYLELLESNSLIDFPLLQLKALEILENNNKTEYKNILIDEFQDSDPVQIKIFESLIENSDSFTVVGDNDQNIYGFRGATEDYFKYFLDNYEVENISLNTNYRSTDEIINLSESFIKNQRPQYSKKQLHGDRGLHRPSFYMESEDKTYEGVKLAELITELKDSNKINSFDEIAILYRSVKSNAPALIEELKDGDIPYQIKGLEDFKDNEAIKAILTLLHFLVDENKPFLTADEVEWLNLRSFCENRFFNLDSETKTSLYNLQEEFEAEIIDREKEIHKELTGKASRIKNLKGVFNREDDELELIFDKVEKPLLDDLAIIENPVDYEFFQRLNQIKEKLKDNEDLTILDLYYQLLDFLDDEFTDEDLYYLSMLSSTMYNYEEMVSKNDLKSFYWFLNTQMKHYTSQKEGSGVQIMTVHKAKGLEFPIVIIAGISKDKFPQKFKNPLDQDYINGKPLYYTPNEYAEFKNFDLIQEEANNELEEQRVVYVAMTRPQDTLILSTVDEKPEIISNLIATNKDSIVPLDINKIDPVDLREKNDFKMINLSHTSLSEYEFCPYKYNLSYNYTFKESQNQEIADGLIVHAALEEINNLLMENKEVDVRKIVKKHAINVDLEKQEDYIEQISYYLDNIACDFNVIASEFEFNIQKDNYNLKGFVDLIYERDGKIGIIDYKYSDIDYYNEKYQNQLNTYILGLRDFFEIEEISIYAIKSKKLIKVPLDEDKIIQRENEIDRLAKKIENEEFNKTKNGKCNFCKFETICKSWIVSTFTLKLLLF